MEYGIKFWNAAYEEQVDSTYANLSYHTSGVWSVGDFNDDLYFLPTSSAPIVGLKPLLTHPILLYGNFGKNTSDQYNRCRIAVPSQQTVNIPYIIFTEPQLGEIPAGEYGVAVYNAVGKLCFHSSRKWWRILSINTISSVVQPTAGYADVTVNNTNNYFMMFPPATYGQFSSQAQYTYLYFLGFRKISTTTLRIEWGSLGSLGDLYGEWAHMIDQSPIFIIEVTAG
jgi:hypothetical protein